MRKNSYFLIGITAISDVVSIILSFILAFWLRFYSGLIEVKKGTPVFDSYISALILIIIICLFIFSRNKLYRKDIISNEMPTVFTSLIFVFLLFMTFTFIYRETEFSRLFIIINFILNYILLSFSRLLIKKMKHYFFKNNKFISNVLLISDDLTFNKLKNKINNEVGYRIIDHIRDIRYLNSINKNFDEVIISIGNKNQEDIIRIMDKIGYDVNYKIIPQSIDIINKRIIPFEINKIILFDVKETNIKGLNKIIKRIFDLIFSSVFFIITSPFFIIISILIKLDSKGPAFYKQIRMTYNKKPFVIYKFRSMIHNTEKLTGPVWARDSDPRITKIGGFLRRTNIDELPQLINVIKGDMSLIGPRPERSFFIEKFKDKIPNYIERNAIKAGMTGWAQVNGYYGNTSIEERIKHDIYYLENWSLLFDIKILLLTTKLFFIKNNH